VKEVTPDPDGGGGGGGGGAAAPFTVKLKLVVRDSDPEVPVTIAVYVPAGVDAEVETVRVEEQGKPHDPDEKEPLAPEGSPDTENDVTAVNPESRLAVMLFVVEDPCVTDLFPLLLSEKSVAGAGAEDPELRRSV
jgi:hypothetical protein